MYKQYFFLLFFFLLISFSIAQQKHSLQINGGLIHPSNSSDGLSGTIQFYYHINEQISFYAYSGYAAWDKYYLNFRNVKNSTIAQDDHSLISFYLGNRINLHTNSFMTSFLNFEAGYSNYKYNKYKILSGVNPETGAIIYYGDYNKQEVDEDVFGLGIGAGLSHPISDVTDLVFTYKLNTFINSSYHGFFTSRGTYSSVSAGVNFYL